MENQNTNNFQLNLRPRESYKAIVESKNEFDQSIFSNVYRKAEKELETICFQLSHYKKHDDPNFIDCPNNIIAFTGNRGSGKTSALTSFLRSLEVDNTYFILPFIDPSAFEPSDSILAMVLASLYRKFDELVTENNKSDSPIDINAKQIEVESAFQNSLRDLQTYHLKKDKSLGDPRDGENPFDKLDRLSSALTIKSNLHGLINSFLALKNTLKKKTDSTRFIIIPIDDLDLNITDAYELIEDIRKHFIIPNTIVFSAVKLTQLSNALEEKYSKNLSSQFKNDAGAMRKFSEEIENMADNYLEKLFPSSRNVEMPQITSREWLKGKETLLKINNQPFTQDENKNAEQILLEHISTNTGILFLPKKENIHPIIPETLRELSNFLSFIDGLAGYKPIERIKAFQKFFLSKFPRYLLSHNEERFITDLIAKSYSTRNKFILENLEYLFPKEYEYIVSEYKSKQAKSEYGEFIKIIERNNFPNKIHIGDILYCIITIEEVGTGDKSARLIFIIRTILNLSIQRAILEKNYEGLYELIGLSIWNLNGIRLSQMKNRVVRTDYSMKTNSSIRRLIHDCVNRNQLDQNLYLASSMISFGLDNRFLRRNVKNSISSNLSKSGTNNIFFDITLPFIWSYYREIEHVPISEKKDFLLSRYFEEFTGNVSDNSMIFQLELLEYLTKYSITEFKNTLKNDRILDSREKSTLLDEIKLIYFSWSTLTKLINFKYGDETIEENFKKMPIVKKVLNESFKENFMKSELIKALSSEIMTNTNSGKKLAHLDEDIIEMWTHKLKVELKFSIQITKIKNAVKDFKVLFSNFFIKEELESLSNFSKITRDNMVSAVELCAQILERIERTQIGREEDEE